MTTEETPRPRIAVAQPVMRRIRALPPSIADAMQAAIRAIGKQTGEPIDLPNERPGTPYLAQHAGVSGAPVLIYRETGTGEEGDYLVVGLLTPEEYRQQKQDEWNPVLQDPAVRRDIAIAARTAATVAVNANPGTPTQGGAAATNITPTDK
jgi:hypothetical protein